MALSKKKKFIFSLVLFCLVVVVPLIAIELFLNVLDKPKPATMGWRFSGFPSEKNELGFRGHPIQYDETNKVIVLLGDSQVQGWGCAYQWMPSKRLEFHLNNLGFPEAKVFSVGAAGYGYDQELLALKEYFEKYRADHVVLWQTLENDVWNNTFPTHQPWNGTPKPTFRLEGEQLVGPNGQIGDTLKSSRTRIGTLVNRVLGHQNRLDAQWAAKYLPEPYQPMTSHDGEVHMAWQESWDKGEIGFRVDNLDEDKNHFNLFLIPRSPRVDYGIRLSKRLLQEIDSLSNSNNASLTTLQATRFDEAFHGSPGEERIYQLNGKFYRVSVDQATKSMKEINQGFDSILIPVREKHWRMGPEDGHLNQHAVDRLMRELAETLSARWKSNQ